MPDVQFWRACQLCVECQTGGDCKVVFKGSGAEGLGGREVCEVMLGGDHQPTQTWQNWQKKTSQKVEPIGSCSRHLAQIRYCICFVI